MYGSINNDIKILIINICIILYVRFCFKLRIYIYLRFIKFYEVGNIFLIYIN